ncbi:MAG: hypothetical protein WCS17_14095 [Prevotella sp.]
MIEIDHTPNGVKNAREVVRHTYKTANDTTTKVATLALADGTTAYKADVIDPTGKVSHRIVTDSGADMLDLLDDLGLDISHSKEITEFIDRRPELREQIRKDKRYVKMSPLLEKLGIVPNNFYSFMAGDIHALSIEKVSAVAAILANLPDEMRG